MPSSRKPWPLPVLYGGMAVFGVAAGMLGLGVGQLIALGAIAACLGWGQP